jgi:hypothetical protein
MVAILCAGSVAYADNDVQAQQSSISIQHYTSYYKIEEPTPDHIQLFSLADLASQAADLLNWALNHLDWPEPDSHYNRLRDFGTWLRDRSGHTCMNTRALLLSETSQVPVQMSHNGCTVRTGRWLDPYSGEVITQASGMQIDHMVPLKNAYVSGAWQWSKKQRCAYTNFMANNFHLLAVSGHENMSKGDATPADWLPSNQAYVCAYVKNWLAVKLIWNLIMNPDEAHAIKQAIMQYHCDPQSFAMSDADLAIQRHDINVALEVCH